MRRHPSLQTRAASALIATAALTVSAPQGAAGDFVDECHSANGAFIRSQGALYDGYAPEGAEPTEYAYETVSETVLRQRLGYCEAQGNQFPFSATLSLVTVRVESPDFGETDVDLLCEVISDGLPAMFSCEEEVVTEEGGLLP